MGQEGFYYNTNSLAVWALAEIQDITNDGMNDIAYGTFSGTIGALTYEMNQVWNFSVGKCNNYKIGNNVAKWQRISYSGCQWNQCW